MNLYLNKFGTSKAGETLALILHRIDDKYLTKKVTRIISQHNEFVNELENMPLRFRKWSAKTIKRQIVTKEWPTIPAECQTFMRNIMIAKIRDTLLRG